MVVVIGAAAVVSNVMVGAVFVGLVTAPRQIPYMLQDPASGAVRCTDAELGMIQYHPLFLIKRLIMTSTFANEAGLPGSQPLTSNWEN